MVVLALDFRMPGEFSEASQTAGRVVLNHAEHSPSSYPRTLNDFEQPPPLILSKTYWSPHTFGTQVSTFREWSVFCFLYAGKG